MLANGMSNKRLISKLHKQTYINSSYNSVNIKKLTNNCLQILLFKMGRRCEKTFFKSRQRNSRHMKRCSASLIAREMQTIKPKQQAMRYHITSVRIAIIKSFNNCGQKCQMGKGNLCTKLVGM